MYYAMNLTKNHNRNLAILAISIALALSLPASAGRPSPSSGTLEAFFNLSTVADNHTIFSAPQEGSETAGGLVGNAKIEDFWIYETSEGFPIYWRFNNDSSVGEDYNATNASLVYDYSGEGNHGNNYGTNDKE